MKTLIKKLLIIFALNSILLSRGLGTLEISILNVQPPGEYEKRNILFVTVKSDSEVMLPLRTSYKNQVFNSDKSVLAINFHGTSDYDSVDLLVQKGKKVFLLTDIWNLIKNDVMQAKIVPTQEWDWVRLEVKSIHGNQLICQFRGENIKPSVHAVKNFNVFIDISKGIIRLKVATMKDK